MARTKRSYAKRLADLQVVGDMLCKGRSQQEVADHLGLSRTQVTYDWAEVKKRWLAQSTKTIEDWIVEQLARIDVMEREAWDAWVRSCHASHKVDAEGRPVAQVPGTPAQADAIQTEKVKRTTTERDGNPAYLETVRWCIDQRCKLLGLYKPTKLSLTDPEGKVSSPMSVSVGAMFNIDHMTVEQKQLYLQLVRDQIATATQALPPNTSGE